MVKIPQLILRYFWYDYCMNKQVHAVGIIFEDETGEVLVLKRHENSPEANTWGLVGGNIDPGEDQLQAAIRESEEEIGHAMPHEKLQFIRRYVWERDEATITFEVYKYSVAKHEIDIVLQEDEATDYTWQLPKKLYERQDLMAGLYPILKDSYNL